MINRLAEAYSKISIKRKILLVVSIFGLIIISYYTIISYNAEKNIVTEKINRQLISSAYSIGTIFGKEYHDGITGKYAISEEQNISNTKLLGHLVSKYKVEYVYTVVLDNDSVFFTSGNNTEEDIKETGYEPFYLYYPEASDSLIACFSDKKVRFEEYTDNYGSFRSVFIPFTTPSGKIYVAGADITLEEINDTLVNVLIKISGAGLFIYLIFLVVLYYIVGHITKPINILAWQSGRITEGQLDTEITINSKDEIGFLSNAVKGMVASLRDSLTSLEKEKATIQKRIDEAVREAKEKKEYLESSINEILIGMEKFAHGDLSVRLTPGKDDEIRVLFMGFNSTVDQFREVINNVKETIDVLVLKSSEISSSAEEMTAGAQDQANQTSDIANSVDQITGTIINTAKNAGEAAANSKLAGDIAAEGKSAAEDNLRGITKIAEVINVSAVTVKQLGKNSQQIGDIAEVINDIADQTNLLALNAAIEAARAGEQGRGFAVVADEVKKLAERTAKATKEISTMIGQIQKDTSEAVVAINKGTEEVDKGKELANKAGETLKQIIQASGKVAEEVSKVASASEQQSAAIEHISNNIESISSVTNQNVSTIQLLARSAEDLNNLTDNLQSLVKRFKIDSMNRTDSVETRIEI